MYKFYIVQHGKTYELECHNSKLHSIMMIYQSTNYGLITRLYDALSIADKWQLYQVINGWTGRTDADELRRLSDILNGGENLYYEQSKNKVYGIEQIYRAFKHDSKSQGGIFRNYLDRRIQSGSLSKTVPLSETGGRVYVGRLV